MMTKHKSFFDIYDFEHLIFSFWWNNQIDISMSPVSFRGLIDLSVR